MGLLPTLLHLLCVYLVLFVRCFALQCTNNIDPIEDKMEKPDPAVLKVVEQKFLEFMGLTSKPSMELKKRIKVPSEMWKLYYRWSNEGIQDTLKNDVDTVRVIDQDGEVQLDHKLQRLAEGKLRFNISGVRKCDKVHKAELHLFTEKQRSTFPLKGSKHLKIYTDISNGTQHLVRVKKVPRNLIGYVKVDITRAVNEWMNDSMQTNTFRVVAQQNVKENSSHLHIRKPRSISNSSWSRKKPLLFIYTSQTGRKKTNTRYRRSISTDNYQKQRRMKNDIEIERIRKSNDIDAERIRQLKEAHSKAQKETCRLRPYYLDFVRLGWNAWIIAPNGYKFNYCIGECPQPLGRYFNTTNHAVIQNSLLKLNRNRVPPLCCIPTDFRDQTFIYIPSSGEILIKHLSEMIAIGCGCH